METWGLANRLSLAIQQSKIAKVSGLGMLMARSESGGIPLFTRTWGVSPFFKSDAQHRGPHLNQRNLSGDHCGDRGMDPPSARQQRTGR